MNVLKSMFGGGVPSVTAQEAKAMMDNGDKPFILDVRQPEEFRSGHIAGAKLIPLGELGNRLEDIPQDNTIICVCRSGSRSSMAASMLARAGYNVLNLEHGMMAWQGAKLPVKKG